MLADELGLPHRRWADYEEGAAIPADVMLLFITLTKANPHWLLTGQGPKYLPGP